MIPSAPLRYLALAKLRGTVRKQWRRMKTVKGLVMTILGVGIFCLWLGAVAFNALTGPQSEATDLPTTVGMMMLFFTLLSMSSALAHRGLYLPKEEIERLFAAPLSRSDLVRYRLLNTLGRSALGAWILGVLAMRHMPSPVLAFLGVVITVTTIPILNQMLAILSGNLAPAISARLRTVPRIVGAVGIVAVVLGVPLYMLADRLPVDEWMRSLGMGERGSFAEHPAVRTALVPFRPWVRMITARDLGEFLPWFGFCAVFWVGLVEATARLPVDFREVSLQTAMRMAERLHRARRGGGAAATGVSKSMARMRVPLLFGQGAGGAIAWRKLCAMVRKAKGTLWVSGLVLLFVTVLSWTVGGDRGGALAGPVLIATLGTVYLCAGLRFDFRDELDRMEVIKAWPLPPRRIFAAMLLPEICMVSGLLTAAIVVRSLAGGDFHPGVIAILLLIPPVVAAWVALDNIVFLFAPVRFVPGQEGALQNAGRGALMLFLRMIALAAVALVGGGPAFGVAWFLREFVGASDTVVYVAATAVLFAALVLLDLALVLLGGLVLSRFDVARDRG